MASTTLPLIDRAALTVVIGSSDEQQQAAESVADELSGLGYTPPALVVVEPSDRTTVYYLPGRRREARRLSEEIGLTVDSLAPAAEGPADVSDDGIDVLIVVGPDGL